MIPVQLKISGFLSYRDPITIDFTAFDLACIAGLNGAGKSSLLDAITWALFGQARKRDDSLINMHPEVNAAEVSLIFSYESNLYHVQRTMPRGKTTILEFHIAQDGVSDAEEKTYTLSDIQWKPLTERTMRETQAKIENTLHLDYDTFVNASFFLQGKADQFTQQKPGERKKILGVILGLEAWEVYRQGASDKRKSLEAEIASLDGRLAEIHTELNEEFERKARLKEYQKQLKVVSQTRKTQENTLENYRKIAATLEKQRNLVETLHRQWDSSVNRLNEINNLIEQRCSECEKHQQTIANAAQIEAGYASWMQARAELENWEKIADQFRQQEALRRQPLDEINAEKARLEQELLTLQTQAQGVAAQTASRSGLETQLAEADARLADIEGKIKQRKSLEEKLQTAIQTRADAKAENQRARTEMDELKKRIDGLEKLTEATCPTCGTPLTSEERQKRIEELTRQGKEMGDRFRANVAFLQESEQIVKDLETQIKDLTKIESQRDQVTQTKAQLEARLSTIAQAEAEWQAKGSLRLLEVTQSLKEEKFSIPERQKLAEIDAELKAIGYDAAAHDQGKKLEAELRRFEGEIRLLEKAQAALEPLQREISNLQSQAADLTQEVARQQEDYQISDTSLKEAEAQAPNIAVAEQELLQFQENENRLRMDVGAAQQKVDVLKGLKTRQKTLDAQREEAAQQVGRYRQLERAFSKDGVPALLIEQALPQIEMKANEILGRLTADSMSIQFITQAAFKDHRRQDMRETLDIRISDSAGARDYEMFSGGEAFRVNFAIRLALSEVLAQRAGARLQTLVIDEGFGSQDALGRQRLIEAINHVRRDFSKILVITHIDELKDAFPTRLEVQKTERGSTITVM
ncbi:MAG: SMC family ATPase [Anaerolineales bacterium]|nr:SMC family ATPase [Anaerolineales bacterium]